jgi:hypothetical protein
MPISVIDPVSPAIQKTRQILFEPFEPGNSIDGDEAYPAAV